MYGYMYGCMYGYRDECPALGCAVDLPENWSPNETTKQKSFSQGTREGSVAMDAQGMGKVRGWSQMDHERNALQGNCNALQHAATRCNTLQHSSACCNTLQHTANGPGTPCTSKSLQHCVTHCSSKSLQSHCNMVSQSLQHCVTHCDCNIV